MEQSVNTFLDGLLLDSHPMVQSNTSLSNALNATFITMNGNEVILLNDMGNRRIDKAYLPAGYIPVGIKEYGGIIYVAAHNPLTHTDLIGSFPSPERNIGEEYPELNAEIKSNFEDYFKSTDGHDVPYESSSTKEIFLTNIESELLILTENNILHAGDKFTTYFKKSDVPGSFDESKISNYNITTGTLFMLNKQYTLYLGVLNAQNLFVDITKSLERWYTDTTEEGTIIDTSNLSEEEKFNTGYFIPKLSTTQVEELTVDDEEYLENRLTKGVNTYAYKLVGPLSLKIGLNTPLNFDYEIRGEMRGGQYYARITAMITYNCPDPMFDFYTEGRFYQKIPADSSNYYKVINDSIDEINNLKTRTIVRECTINPNPDNSTNLTRYPYYIGVQTFTNNSNYYLEKFWDEGYLDLTLFGSGNIKLTGWRFYNDWDESSNDAECYLSCNVMAYPKLDEKISNLQIAFSENKHEEINDNNTPNYAPMEDLTWTTLSPLVGKVGMFKSSWKELGNLKPQKLYWVHFRWKSSDSDNTDGYKYAKNAAFFLTTNLFNSCYTLGSEDFIDNFNKFSTVLYTDELSSEEETIVKKYQTINIYPNFTTNLSRGVPDIDITGLTLLKKKEENETETDFPASVKVKYNINCSITDNGLIYDKIKYPSNIITDDSLIRASNGATYEISHKDYTIGLKDNDDISINTIVEGGKNFTNALTFSTISDAPSNNSQCTFSVELPEYFNSGITSDNITINNAFITLKEAIQNLMNDEDYKYINFVLGYCIRTGDPDHKVIRLLCLNKSFENKSNQNITVGENSTFNISNSCDQDYDPEKMYANNRRWESGTDKEHLELNFDSKYYISVDTDSNDNHDYIFNYDLDDLLDLSRHNIPDKQNFSYLFIDNPADSLHPDYYECFQRFYHKTREKKPKGINNRNYTLLFWRGNDDSWYIYPKLIQKKMETSETGLSLLDVLGNSLNLYYSYEVIKEDVSNLSAHDTNSYIYTLPYSVDFKVKFSVSYTEETEFNINGYNDFRIFKTEFNKTNEIDSTTTLEAKSLQNYIPKLLSNTFSNVVTSTSEEDSKLIGTFTDGNGNELLPYTIYYKKSEELMPLSNNLNKTFAVSNPVGNYRHLVPKTQPYEGDFEYKYLVTGQDDDKNEISTDHTVIFELSKMLLTNEFLSFRSLTTETEQESSTSSSNSSSNSSSSGYSSGSSDNSKLWDYYQPETINKDSITDADLLQRYKTMQP